MYKDMWVGSRKREVWLDTIWGATPEEAEQEYYFGIERGAWVEYYSREREQVLLAEKKRARAREIRIRKDRKNALSKRYRQGKRVQESTLHLSIDYLQQRFSREIGLPHVNRQMDEDALLAERMGF